MLGVAEFPTMSSETEILPARGPTTVSRLRPLVLAIMTLQLLVLLATGVVLFFTYRPTGSAVYGELYGDDVGSSIDLARATTTVHRMAALSAVPTAIIAVVLVAIEKHRWRRRRLDVLVGAGIALMTMVGSVTGNLLPWDQLGLWAVSVGSNMRGYTPLFDDNQVRFVLIGGAEVAPGTIVQWLLFHMLVVGSILGVLLAVAWRRRTQQHAIV